MKSQERVSLVLKGKNIRLLLSLIKECKNKSTNVVFRISLIYNLFPYLFLVIFEALCKLLLCFRADSNKRIQRKQTLRKSSLERSSETKPKLFQKPKQQEVKRYNPTTFWRKSLEEQKGQAPNRNRYKRRS